jgi:hypothetical protein
MRLAATVSSMHSSRAAGGGGDGLHLIVRLLRVIASTAVSIEHWSTIQAQLTRMRGMDAQVFKTRLARRYTHHSHSRPRRRRNERSCAARLVWTPCLTALTWGSRRRRESGLSRKGNGGLWAGNVCSVAPQTPSRSELARQVTLPKRCSVRGEIGLRLAMILTVGGESELVAFGPHPSSALGKPPPQWPPVVQLPKLSPSLDG